MEFMLSSSNCYQDWVKFKTSVTFLQIEFELAAGQP